MSGQIYPEPTVGVLIVNPRGEIFLMKSHKWKGKYVIPGGHIELGEMMAEAVKREVREETGLEVYDIKLLCLQEFVYDKAFWKKKHFIFLDFMAKTKSPKVKLNDEGQEYTWVKPNGLSKLPVDPYTLRTIEKYRKKAKV